VSETVERKLVAIASVDVAGYSRLMALDELTTVRTLTAYRQEISRGVLEYRGRVVDDPGDNALLEFPSATDAVNWAISFQSAIEVRNRDVPDDRRVRFRIGIHIGEVLVQGDRIYGDGVNIAARLEGMAPIGGIVVSETVRDQVQTKIEAPLCDLGDQALKNIPIPVRMFRVDLGGGESDSRDPPFGSTSRADAEDGSNNLPATLSSFVGRVDEIEAITRLLDHHRLVTITGAGGVGKSRLALEVARRQDGKFTNGVWFVCLTEIKTAEALPRVILKELCLSAPSDRSAEQALIEQIDGGHLLLVLDDCERIVDDVARIVHRLLSAAPGLRILTTSREPLQVEGERPWGLQPLDTSSETAESDSVRLFIERLPQGIDPTTLDHAMLAQVCRRLDGLPLAIELAAARMRSLSLHDIDQRLDDRLSILTGGSRTALQHHRTLLATLEWSYDLLDPATQRGYKVLSVLPGTFTLSAAEAVLRGEDLDPLEALEHLTAQSLLFLETSNGVSDYRMLESVRQHGRLLLENAGGTDKASSSLSNWAADLAREVRHRYKQGEHVLWAKEIARNMSSLRAALEWTAENDPTKGLSIAIALAPYWWGQSLVEDTQGVRSTPTIVEGAAWMERMLEAAEATAPPKLLAVGRLAFAGNLLNRLGRSEEAIDLLGKARAFFHASEEKHAEGMCLYFEGVTRMSRSEDPEVESQLRGALELLDSDPNYHLYTILFLVWYLLDHERTAEALALMPTTPPPETWPVSAAHFDEAKANLTARMGLPVIVEDLRRAWNCMRTTEASCVIHLLQSMAYCMAAGNERFAAAKLLGVSQRLQDEMGIAVANYENRERYTLPLLESMTFEARQSAYNEGRALSPRDGLDYAESLLPEAT